MKKKKTIILTQEQINEISGFALNYLDGTMPDIYGNEISAEGCGVEGEIPDEKLDTDTSAAEKTTEFLRGMMPRGRDVCLYEMSKKDWEKKKVYNEAKHMHGNKRIKKIFGDSNNQYKETELNQQLYRYREALKDYRSSDPQKKAKGIKSLQRMYKNRLKDGKTTALKQYDSAKRADKIIQGSKPEGTKIKSSPKQYGNGKSNTKNGIITLY